MFCAQEEFACNDMFYLRWMLPIDVSKNCCAALVIYRSPLAGLLLELTGGPHTAYLQPPRKYQTVFFAKMPRIAAKLCDGGVLVRG